MEALSLGDKIHSENGSKEFEIFAGTERSIFGISEVRAADGLSRIDPSEVNTIVLLMALIVPSAIQLQDLYKELDEDEYIQKLRSKVQEGVMKKGLLSG